MSDKEIIDGANALALQFFTAYNRMLQLTGNSEEALKLTNSLFEAMFAGNRPRPDPGAGGFTLYWGRREGDYESFNRLAALGAAFSGGI